ncbi:PBP1A family penicillin-binding protein [Parvibaculum sedimenti]|uniref:Penicillin-binding protein 1A n=1 Tax=Parvibaculum sedimenti TaxID=2608632 RepID=A0A6N6VHM9_9HYPH|nr:penicillin-binding protein 1A [Parvibaculum sedimenti]KAB7740528.1 PBP1A family penicillin-binding protein [Parvibaculum sedimenti]
MLRVLKVLSALFLVAVAGVALVAGYVLWQMNIELPDYSKLANYEPPVMTRVHAGDGELIAEYARERRIYVPISAIPKRVIQAFLAAEDKNFYTHSGVDPMGIMRAMVDNVFNVLNDRRLVGASTITQQVARNFLLTRDRNAQRKITEILLSLRMEKAYSKEKILELYLNEIYLGTGSYGIAAAALNYFDKPLDQLSVAEVAYLASLPKGPENYNPYTHRDRAIARRNWVIGRMEEDGFVTPEDAKAAQAEPFRTVQRPVGVQLVDASYFVEEVRRELYSQFGEQKLYEGGLSVRTTIDTHLQAIVRRSLRKGLVDYDQRHGYRGPVASLKPGENWQEALEKQKFAEDLAPWTLGVVLDLSPTAVKIGLRPEKLPNGKFSTDVKTGTIAFADMSWARKSIKDVYLGPVLKQPSDALAIGDVIYVERLAAKGAGAYALRQVPAVNGSVIAMDPHTGRVLAMQGGFSFDQSEFNRATQALRQPGSSFKPFVYAAALDSGFTPSSLVLDAPFVMDQGPGLGLWKPENYEKDFFGPSTLRFGLEHSRNVMTVRLAQAIGMDKVAEYAHRFGVIDNMQPVLAMSLGAGETTLMRLAAAYSTFDNGGKKVKPTLIDRVQDRWGRTIYKSDNRPCPDCNADWTNQAPPELPDDREQIESPQTAYQITSMLEGVVQRGTGSAVKAVGVPLAGKTGTSSDERDAWFMGYSPHLVVGVFVGYDTPAPLGRAETGGRTAAPVFRDIMQAEIGGEPAIPFRIPPGISLVKVDHKTGQLATSSDPDVILEAFKEGTEPQASSNSSLNVVTGTPVTGTDGGTLGAPASSGGGAIDSGTGGLY